MRSFLDEARMRGLSDKTTYNCKLTLRRLGTWAADTGRPPVLYLTTSDLIEWCKTQRHVLPQTMHGYLVQIRMFTAWAVTRGLLDTDPALKIDLPKLPDRLPDPMPEHVYRDVMAGADDDMRVILGLAGFSGLRACEIAWLAWSGVRFSDMRLRILGKGSRERIFPMSPDLGQLLTALPVRSGPVVRRLDGQRGHNDPHTVSQRANSYLHAMGSTWTLHKLRHRFGTVALAQTGNLLAVAELMGHRNPATTQIYARVSPDHLQAAAHAAGKFVA